MDGGTFPPFLSIKSRKKARALFGSCFEKSAHYNMGDWLDAVAGDEFAETVDGK